MKKTKIVVTMGPAIADEKILRDLIKRGLNVLRINFSHSSQEEAKKRIAMLDNLNKELITYAAWLCDIRGPEIRINKVENDLIFLEKDSYLNLHPHEILGNSKDISVTYDKLYQKVKKGSKILLADGLIELEVSEINDKVIKTKILNSGYLGSKKGVNVPNVKLNMEYLNQKDIDDIVFACQNKASYIAASFVRNAHDVLLIKELCAKNNRQDMQIIAKIENQEGVDNIDEILATSNGVMVARGDLGTEVALEEVPIIQKMLCQKANRLGKPIIIATDMLDSMQRNPRPTRAEVGDVSRAVVDGADALMLSGETAQGEYPILAVETMARIVSRSEDTIDHNKILQEFIGDIGNNPYDGIGLAAVELAKTINAKAIFCFTETGATARQISKYRPNCLIYALSQHDDTLRSLSLAWGVVGVKKKAYLSLESKYDIVNVEAKQLELNNGDYVIITGGHPDGVPITNFLKIQKISL